MAERATKGPWTLFSDIDTKTFSIHTPRDKRCENVIKWGGFDCQPNAEANAEFIAAFNPKVALALLDENIQLQREKDAIEAVALALRDDMRQAREQLEAAEKRIAEQREYYEGVIADGSKRIAELERSETQLINERDSAESALNDAYKAVMGQAPEWSNWFSFGNAIDEIELACEQWRNQTDDVIQFRQRIAELEAREVTLPAQRFCPGEYVGSVLWAETEIWNKAISACDFAVRAAGIKVKGE
ncbi:ead/Ea22-like family protein [Salmonella enterica subsp. enterica serovar Napoli]|nr:ead/Ea22-like family protein [Salmonella enterica subsp. enterica serovar Napoli]ECG6272888.1 ead/Ea22-like family protein [Salmonella enterica subsp. enterica serovar Napoli]ECY6273522.1 ead/Ea22-like family protein [Salmonella enterica subsp. enterica serovar Napoli]EDR6622214.1 ead/Ea22-like family protein [Salmonella enterica subsp. enterica]MLK63374.1 ead/Ea22-like family protein [Salmonella enterica subsp. enterica serovar Napoli]